MRWAQRYSQSYFARFDVYFKRICWYFIHDLLSSVIPDVRDSKKMIFMKDSAKNVFSERIAAQ